MAIAASSFADLQEALIQAGNIGAIDTDELHEQASGLRTRLSHGRRSGHASQDKSTLATALRPMADYLAVLFASLVLDDEQHNLAFWNVYAAIVARTKLADKHGQITTENDWSEICVLTRSSFESDTVLRFPNFSFWKIAGYILVSVMLNGLMT